MLGAQNFSSHRGYIMYKMTALLAAGITAVMSLVPGAVLAQSTTAKAMLILSPETSNISVGETMSVKVLLDTKGISVSQVDFRLKYDPTFFAVQDNDLEKAGIQIKDGTLFEVLLSTSPVNASAGVIQYSKIALSDSHYHTTSGQPSTLATIDFKALKAGATKLQFDTTATAATQPTKIYRASDEVQVLGEVTNGEYVIKEATQAQPSVTASPTATSTAASAPTISSSPTASTTAKPALSMTLDKVSLKADGKDVAQVKAVVKDKQGQILPNTKVLFSITGSALLSPTSATTDAKGQAVTSLTAGTQAGTIVLTARLETDATVTATSQISSVAVATTSPTATVSASPRPTVTSTARPTSSPKPQPLPVPNQLDQVGPGSMYLLLVSGLLSGLYFVRRQVAVSIRNK